MSEVKVIDFQINYMRLNKKLSQYPQTYLCCKALCWSDILTRHNACVKKWLKPTSKGTKVNCVPLETKEQIEEEKKKINNCLQEAFSLPEQVKEMIGELVNIKIKERFL